MNKTISAIASQAIRVRIGAALAAILLTALLLQGCGSQPDNADAASSDGQSGAKAPAELRIGYIGSSKLNVPDGAEGWGFYKNLISDELKKYGVSTFTFVSFPSGPDLNESLISDRIDVGIYGDTPALLVRSTGAKIRIFSQPTIKTNIYLIGKKNGPKTVADLKGQKVGTQKGSILHRFAVGALDEAGIGKDVDLLHIPTTELEAALARGEIAAGTSTGINAKKLQDEGYPLLDEAANHPLLLGTTVAAVSETYLKKFPQFPSVFNAARAKSLADLKAHPDDYYKFAADREGISPELVQFAEPIENIAEQPFSDDGLKQLEAAKKFLIDQKLIDKDFSIDDWIVK